MDEMDEMDPSPGSRKCDKKMSTAHTGVERVLPRAWRLNSLGR